MAKPWLAIVFTETFGQKKGNHRGNRGLPTTPLEALGKQNMCI